MSDTDTDTNEPQIDMAGPAADPALDAPAQDADAVTDDDAAAEADAVTGDAAEAAEADEPVPPAEELDEPVPKPMPASDRGRCRSDDVDRRGDRARRRGGRPRPRPSPMSTRRPRPMRRGRCG